MTFDLQNAKMAFRSNTWIFCTIIIIGVGNGVSGEISFKKGAPHAKLVNEAVVSGSVKFSRDGRPYASFLGIPFATIPGRFEEAKIINGGSWNGTFAALNPGPACLQLTLGNMAGEEDCLNLNVHVPMNNSGREGGHPVMVWVHGGGFISGAGHLYGPSFFMDEDVILITINYRLGVFGFLSTGDSIVPGNNGLKDQVLALQWVQENIKNFGGSPNRVTVFGQSAGAVAVHYLMLSQTTKGLFQRAISQSGTALAPWAYHSNPRESAVKLATHLQCPTTSPSSSEITSEEIMTCLKDQSVESLVKAQFVIKDRWPETLLPFSFGPVKEPITHTSAFMTQSPWEIINDKTIPLVEIPWAVGATEDEGSTFYAGVALNKPELINELDTNFDSIAPLALKLESYLDQNDQAIVVEKIRKFYFGNNAITLDMRVNVTNLYSDMLTLHSVYKAAIETSSRGKRNPVFLYQYAHKGPDSWFKMLGFSMSQEEMQKIGHGDDLLLLFDFDDSMRSGEEALIQSETVHEQFSKNLVKLWVSFAVHGEPKHSWGPQIYRKWKRVTREEQTGTHPLKWFRIGSQEVRPVEDLYSGRMQFCDQLWTELLTPAVLVESASGGDTAAKTEL